MLKLKPVQKEMLEQIENTLSTEFVSNLAQTRGATPRADGRDLQLVRPSDRDALPSSLDGINHERPTRIRSLMFTFEDLAKLDPAACRRCCARSTRHARRAP